MTDSKRFLDDLVEALQIFMRYDENSKTYCEDDVLVVVGPKNDDVSAKHKTQLTELGFFCSEEYDGWSSFKFGSYPND